MNFIFLCLSFIANTLMPTQPAYAGTLDTSGLQSAFQTLSAQSVWPVSDGLSSLKASMKMQEATFGPRMKVSSKAYDWHRGIDIKAPINTPVVAALNGELWKTDNYPDGGTSVVIRHTFPSPITYAGKQVKYFYTMYMHLNSIDPAIQAAANAKLHPAVKAGQVIGAVGHSGSGAVGDHLHFELRVGSWCTLEYQLAYPASSCSGFGFDPAMHPLWLFPAQANNAEALTLVKQPLTTQDGVIKWSNIHEQPILNRVELYPKGVAQPVSVMDLNTRVGFNATKQTALDTPDTTLPYFAPLAFSTSTASYATTVVIPKSYLSALRSKYQYQHFTLQVTDIFGKAVSYSW